MLRALEGTEWAVWLASWGRRSSWALPPLTRFVFASDWGPRKAKPCFDYQHKNFHPRLPNSL